MTFKIKARNKQGNSEMNKTNQQIVEELSHKHRDRRSKEIGEQSDRGTKIHKQINKQRGRITKIKIKNTAKKNSETMRSQNKDHQKTDHRKKIAQQRKKSL